MGSFKNTVENKQAEPLFDRYQAIGNTAWSIVDQIQALGVQYAQLRSDIAAGGDAEDTAVADAGFDLTVAQAALKFDALTEEQRAWVDKFFEQLGYVKQ